MWYPVWAQVVDRPRAGQSFTLLESNLYLNVRQTAQAIIYVYIYIYIVCMYVSCLDHCAHDFLGEWPKKDGFENGMTRSLAALCLWLGSLWFGSAFFTRLSLRLSDIVVTRLDTPRDKSLIFYFPGSRLIVCTRVQKGCPMWPIRWDVRCVRR